MMIIIFWVALVVLVAVWASRWNRSGFGFGCLAFFFSPLLAALVLLIKGRKAPPVPMTRRAPRAVTFLDDEGRVIDTPRAEPAPEIAPETLVMTIGVKDDQRSGDLFEDDAQAKPKPSERSMPELLAAAELQAERAKRHQTSSDVLWIIVIPAVLFVTVLVAAGYIQ